MTVVQPKSVSWNLFWCLRSPLKICLPLCDRQKVRRSSFTSKCPKTSSWPLTLGRHYATVLLKRTDCVVGLLFLHTGGCAMPVGADWQSMGSAGVPHFSLQEEGWWTWFDEGLMHAFFTHTLIKMQVAIILLHLGWSKHLSWCERQRHKIIIVWSLRLGGLLKCTVSRCRLVHKSVIAGLSSTGLRLD